MNTLDPYSRKTCSSCLYWSENGLLSDEEDNNMTIISLCDLQQRGHDRAKHPEWMRGSDGCSKWRRIDKSVTPVPT